jgi:amino acid transporter
LARETRLLREFSWRSAFSLAFAFISPIVGLYSIFPLGLAAAGPGFFFAFPIVLAGQVLVALVFGMLVSRYPLEGCIYQWSKHLVGPRYAWFGGWIYAWALPIAMAAVAVAGAHFLAQILGLDPESPIVASALSLALIAFATWGNTQGRYILNAVVGLCIVAEIVGSVGLGVVLLLFHRTHPLAFLTTGPTVSHASASIAAASIGAFFHSPAALAVAIAGWALLGFESAGSIAEEVKDPANTLPKAMLLSLLCVAAVISFSALAFILSLPPGDPLRGPAADPIAATLTLYFGHTGFKFMLGVFMIGFVACILGTQASVSRVVWAFARDDELPGSRWIARLSGVDRLPVNAVLLTALMAFSMFAFTFTNIYPTLVAFTTDGFYIAFAFPILAAAWQHLRGRWQPGPFHLGIFTGPVMYAAAVWIVFETINIGWPRSPEAPWYEDWAVPFMFGILAVGGVCVRGLKFRDIPK